MSVKSDYLRPVRKGTSPLSPENVTFDNPAYITGSAPVYENTDEYEHPPPRYEELQLDTYTTLKSVETASVKSSSSPNKKYVLVTVILLLALSLLLGLILGFVLAGSGDDDKSDKTTTSSTATTTTSTSSPSSAVPGSTTTSLPPGPGWTTWSHWGDCSASCGGGEQTRTRECEPTGTVCKGTDTQGQSCNTHTCPRPDYGEWSSWSGWSDCTHSCGEEGQQYRSRRCDKDSSEQLDCPGDVQGTDQRPCNRFDCPTCSRPCPDGGSAVSPDCDQCICSGQTFSARVVSSTNMPLALVSVSDVEVPSLQLAVTDSSGQFTIDDACHGIILQFERYDLITTTATMSPSLSRVTMEATERLDITQHPEHRERLVGESVRFCCEAEGNPPPDNYEWFHNGVVIKGDAGTSAGTLILDNLKESDAGSYECRASNDQGSIKSDEAVLKVQGDRADFCSVHPGVNVITLPVGCEQADGSLEMDVGGCKADGCPHEGGSDDGECSDDTEYCCGPTDLDRVNVQCNGYRLPVYMVTKCGCIVCQEQKIYVLGLVLDLNNKPISTTTLSINGTDYNVNKDGEFTLQIPAVTRRLPLSIREDTGSFAEITKVIFIPRNAPKVFYTVVHLLPYTDQPDINPGVESLVTIGKEKPFAQIDIPANSIHTMSGDLFTGSSVRVQAGIVDPRNYTDILNSPGDFSTISETGVRERLKSYGMFSLRLSDPATGEQLQLKDKVQVALDNSNMGGEVDKDGSPLAKLWSLNKNSGNWEWKSSMVKENESFPLWRRAKSLKDASLFEDITIGEIEIIGDSWYNFDGQEHRTCYSKVRLYANNAFKDGSQLTNGRITTVALRDSSGEKLYADVSSYTAYTDNDYPDNGYCVAGFCQLDSDDREYQGFIIAEHDGQRLHAADENSDAYFLGIDPDTASAIEYKSIEHETYPGVETKFSIPKVPEDMGPFYNWEGSLQRSETCSSAEVGKNHFRFYKEDVLSSLCSRNEVYVIHEQVLSPPPIPSSLNWFAWFADSHNNNYKVCYVKAIIRGGVGHIFDAKSHLGTCSHPDGDVGVGDLLGIDQQCPSANEQAFCFEVKHPEVPTEGTGEISCDVVDNPYITIGESATSGTTCQLTSTNEFLEALYGEHINSTSVEFGMQLPERPFGSDFGIYCSQAGDTADKNRASALQMCANGGNDQLNMFKADMTLDNPAIEFDCT